MKTKELMKEDEGRWRKIRKMEEDEGRQKKMEEDEGR
jgi:hypothetical protein